MNPGRKISELAKTWGIPQKSIISDFKWWCNKHGLDPYDFLKRGYVRTGYWAPQEFFDWWYRTMFPQYIRWGRIKVDKRVKAVLGYKKIKLEVRA